MTHRIRVMHVVNNLNYGGLERVVAEVIQRTDAARFESHVLALGYVGHFGEGLDKVATVHTGVPMSRLSMVRPVALARQIAAIAPDVVHLHSGVLYKASLAAKIAGVPRQIFTDHGRQNPDPWLHRAIDKRAARRVDVIVAVSGKLKTHLETFMPRNTRICVIPNGVNTDRYFPQEDDLAFRSELGIDANIPVIGSVGRLESIKGYAVMMEAFEQLRREWRGSVAPTLVLVGDGSERASLELSAARLGVANFVHFMGWRSDIERISRAFTVFAMSSHSEGTSVSLLEAMSSGLCPVVTNVGGNAAVLGPELSHRLVASNDPPALARALTECLTAVELRERDSTLARARVEKHFGLDAMVRSYESLYNEGFTDSGPAS